MWICGKKKPKNNDRDMDMEESRKKDDEIKRLQEQNQILLQQKVTEGLSKEVEELKKFRGELTNFTKQFQASFEVLKTEISSKSNLNQENNKNLNKAIETEMETMRELRNKEAEIIKLQEQNQMLIKKNVTEGLKEEIEELKVFRKEFTEFAKQMQNSLIALKNETKETSSLKISQPIEYRDDSIIRTKQIELIEREMKVREEAIRLMEARIEKENEAKKNEADNLLMQTERSQSKGRQGKKNEIKIQESPSEIANPVNIILEQKEENIVVDTIEKPMSLDRDDSLFEGGMEEGGEFAENREGNGADGANQSVEMRRNSQGILINEGEEKKEEEGEVQQNPFAGMESDEENFFDGEEVANGLNEGGSPEGDERKSPEEGDAVKNENPENGKKNEATKNQTKMKLKWWEKE